MQNTNIICQQLVCIKGKIKDNNFLASLLYVSAWISLLLISFSVITIKCYATTSTTWNVVSDLCLMFVTAQCHGNYFTNLNNKMIVLWKVKEFTILNDSAFINYTVKDRYQTMQSSVKWSFAWARLLQRLYYKIIANARLDEVLYVCVITDGYVTDANVKSLLDFP